MKIAKILVLLLICTLLVATLSACKVEGYTSTTTTDADGNETTETTTYSSEDGTNTTTETTEAGDGDEASGEAEAGAGAEASEIPAALAEFIATVEKNLQANGVDTTVTPVNGGDGNYALTTNSEELLFNAKMDGDSPVNFTVTCVNADEKERAIAFVILISALVGADASSDIADSLIYKGEASVATENWTFATASGETNGQPFEALVASVN